MGGLTLYLVIDMKCCHLVCGLTLYLVIDTKRCLLVCCLTLYLLTNMKRCHAVCCLTLYLLTNMKRCHLVCYLTWSPVSLYFLPLSPHPLPRLSGAARLCPVSVCICLSVSPCFLWRFVCLSLSIICVTVSFSQCCRLQCLASHSFAL